MGVFYSRSDALYPLSYKGGNQRDEAHSIYLKISVSV